MSDKQETNWRSATERVITEEQKIWTAWIRSKRNYASSPPIFAKKLSEVRHTGGSLGQSRKIASIRTQRDEYNFYGEKSMSTVIHLHPELTISDVRRMALAHGMTLTEDVRGNYILAPSKEKTLLRGAFYRPGADLRETFERVKQGRDIGEHKPALTIVGK